MRNPLTWYIRWLHTQWPAGRVEPLPHVREDGSTNLPGLYIVGDLTGIPLLKFAADSGARAVQTISADPTFQRLREDRSDPRVLDLVIIGGGVSGMAAALEARRQGLTFALLEASEPFSTIVNFPKAKPIFTYPTEMRPAGDLQVSARVKEELVEELRAQTRQIQPLHRRAERVARRGKWLEVVVPEDENLLARRVIVGIGRSGNFRRLGVPGENLGKVFNRLHDPKDFAGKRALVVGGGDSALETAIALAQCGADVTISHRGREFTRPKPENLERLRRLRANPMAEVGVKMPLSERVTASTGGHMREHRRAGEITALLGTEVKEITEGAVTLIDSAGEEHRLPNDVVFAMIGREPPLDFFRRSGVHIRGEWRVSSYVSLALVLLAAVFVFHWKKDGVYLGLNELFARNHWFPFNLPDLWASLGGAFARPSHLLGTLRVSLGDPGFHYSLAYCACVAIFGFRRIRRRKTPYVRRQTLTLAAIQIGPLFLLPHVLLPWAGNNGWFDSGPAKAVADALFPAVDYGHGREYWRAFGLILAWPLFIWNTFTAQPLWAWLIISLVQTFVIIPLIVLKWGKGAYCGWICSCGALAETMGDAHRHKMPHGPLWNRVNLVGQVFLLFALALLATRLVSWAVPGTAVGARLEAVYDYLLHGLPLFNYVWFVDLLWAGILGVGLYWHFSGRVWCRFACPLAALMHICARFSRFAIIPEKKRCISCNVCTSVCHQGIDVMNFANKGLPMRDPECVRCSACVQSCPTGVLQFGEVNPRSAEILRLDRLAASPVLMRERDHVTAAGMRLAGGIGDAVMRGAPAPREPGVNHLTEAAAGGWQTRPLTSGEHHSPFPERRMSAP